MIRARRALALLALLAAPAVAAPADRPLYLRRLELPVASDGFGYPRAVTADLNTGELFVCDTRKSRIVIFDRDGLFSFEIAGGDSFSAPLDLAVDEAGLLVVVANHGGRSGLIELDFDGAFRRRIELSGLPPGSAEPRASSVALSPAGRRLYVVDRENRALWITDRGGSVTGRVDLSADLSPAESRDLLLGKVDVYGDRVLVALSSTAEILSFDLDGKPLGRTGIQGGSTCKLGRPAAAALAADGSLLVVDQQRMLIQRWQPARNRCLGEYWGLGISPGYLYYPVDLALDGAGRIYVAQGWDGRVQAYDAGSPAAVAGIAPAAPEPAVEEVAEAPVIAPAPPAAQTDDPAVDPRAGIEAAIEAWAAAWSGQRAEEYLAAYSPAFRPASGAPRAAWESQRRGRLARPKWIEVELSELRVEDAEQSRPRAVFRQRYASNLFRDCVLKTLVWHREDGAWRIVEERVEATLPAGSC